MNNSSASLSSFSEFFPQRGRSARDNPGNRFERLYVEFDGEALDELRRDPDFEAPQPKTEFLEDDSQSIITSNVSPDIGFDASLNPYRGCEHGCSYCYARPYHEYLGFSAGLDFESRILVKPNAARLLENELSSKNWRPRTLACSGVTDPYQPVERQLEITRGCLEILARCRNPVVIVTKNHLVTRDIDHLKRLAECRAAAVLLSVTSLDQELASKMEPRASSPEFRLKAIGKLAGAGIPTGVSVAPIIPGLNDHEIPAILEAAAARGASFAAYTVIRLPHGVSGIFLDWLKDNYPLKHQRVENRIRELRGGKLNDSHFNSRMKGRGAEADRIRNLFEVSARRFGLNRQRLELSAEHFRPPGGQQLEFF